MEFRDFGVIVKLSMSLEIPRGPRRVAGFLSHVGGYKYYSFNYQYYLEYLLFLIPLVFLFYRIVKIHFRCESSCMVMYLVLIRVEVYLIM